MIALYRRGTAVDIAHPLMCRVEAVSENKCECQYHSLGDHKKFSKVLTVSSESSINGPGVVTVPDIHDFEIGDLLVIQPSGEIELGYRKSSHHNSLFVTDTCNSFCLMCSQPPKKLDDIGWRMRVNTALLEVIPKSCEMLGITGGEPTLLGENLAELFRHARKNLPSTQFHMLTNGRLLSNPEYVKPLVAAAGRSCIFAVPVYSDSPGIHDWVVQAKGAFSETLNGLYNLAREGVRIEIRIVLHKPSVERLTSWAKFVTKYLPFVEHVALMGMEYTGFVHTNYQTLWIEPIDYQDSLESAFDILKSAGIDASIYNVPLCLLSEGLRKNAKRSISAWKQEYVEECQDCTQIAKCCGVFATSKQKFRGITSIS